MARFPGSFPSLKHANKRALVKFHAGPETDLETDGTTSVGISSVLAQSPRLPHCDKPKTSHKLSSINKTTLDDANGRNGSPEPWRERMDMIQHNLSLLYDLMGVASSDSEETFTGFTSCDISEARSNYEQLKVNGDEELSDSDENGVDVKVAHVPTVAKIPSNSLPAKSTRPPPVTAGLSHKQKTPLFKRTSDPTKKALTPTTIITEPSLVCDSTRTRRRRSASRESTPTLLTPATSTTQPPSIPTPAIIEEIHPSADVSVSGDAGSSPSARTERPLTGEKRGRGRPRKSSLDSCKSNEQSHSIKTAAISESNHNEAPMKSDLMTSFAKGPKSLKVTPLFKKTRPSSEQVYDFRDSELSSPDLPTSQIQLISSAKERTQSSADHLSADRRKRTPGLKDEGQKLITNYFPQNAASRQMDDTIEGVVSNTNLDRTHVTQQIPPKEVINEPLLSSSQGIRGPKKRGRKVAGPTEVLRDHTSDTDVEENIENFTPDPRHHSDLKKSKKLLSPQSHSHHHPHSQTHSHIPSTNQTLNADFLSMPRKKRKFAASDTSSTTTPCSDSESERIVTNRHRTKRHSRRRLCSNKSLKSKAILYADYMFKKALKGDADDAGLGTEGVEERDMRKKDKVISKIETLLRAGWTERYKKYVLNQSLSSSSECDRVLSPTSLQQRKPLSSPTQNELPTRPSRVGLRSPVFASAANKSNTIISGSRFSFGGHDSPTNGPSSANTNSMSKNILRKARLTLNKKTLQKIRSTAAPTPNPFGGGTTFGTVNNNPTSIQTTPMLAFGPPQVPIIGAPIGVPIIGAIPFTAIVTTAPLMTTSTMPPIVAAMDPSSHMNPATDSVIDTVPVETKKVKRIYRRRKIGPNGKVIVEKSLAASNKLNGHKQQHISSVSAVDDDGTERPKVKTKAAKKMTPLSPLMNGNVRQDGSYPQVKKDKPQKQRPVPTERPEKITEDPKEKISSGQPGWVTCNICLVTKYYSHVQRRYGQFSCEPCSKFFARFLRDPKIFYCESTGECPIAIELMSTGSKTPLRAASSRCKACWLKVCISKFALDDKIKETIVTQFAPRTASAPDVPLIADSNLDNDPITSPTKLKREPQRISDSLLVLLPDGTYSEKKKSPKKKKPVSSLPKIKSTSIKKQKPTVETVGIGASALLEGLPMPAGPAEIIVSQPIEDLLQSEDPENGMNGLHDPLPPISTMLGSGGLLLPSGIIPLQVSSPSPCSPMSGFSPSPLTVQNGSHAMGGPNNGNLTTLVSSAYQFSCTDQMSNGIMAHNIDSNQPPITHLNIDQFYSNMQAQLQPVVAVPLQAAHLIQTAAESGLKSKAAKIKREAANKKKFPKTMKSTNLNNGNGAGNSREASPVESNLNTVEYSLNHCSATRLKSSSSPTQSASSSLSSPAASTSTTSSLSPPLSHSHTHTRVTHSQVEASTH